jgi:hypothetical protein
MAVLPGKLFTQEMFHLVSYIWRKNWPFFYFSDEVQGAQRDFHGTHFQAFLALWTVSCVYHSGKSTLLYKQGHVCTSWRSHCEESGCTVGDQSVHQIVGWCILIFRQIFCVQYNCHQQTLIWPSWRLNNIKFFSRSLRKLIVAQLIN